MPISPEELQSQFASLRSIYDDSGKKDTTHILLISPSGVGKTQLLETAPAPILIDSFDPGGAQHLREQIEKGRVIYDPRYEIGGFQSYELWEKNFNERRRAGLFENLGTYVIDSGTMWAPTILAKIAEMRRVDGIGDPTKKWKEDIYELQDYNRFQNIYLRLVKQLTSLPCNFILTGHLDQAKDEALGRIFYSISTEGQKVKEKLQLLFSEVWYLELSEKNVAGKIVKERKIKTEYSTLYPARTRIGRGKFLSSEEPHIANLLKKAGYPWEDKPLFR